MKRRCRDRYCALLLAGCGDRLQDIGREPHLTPVGAGLQPNRVAC